MGSAALAGTDHPEHSTKEPQPQPAGHQDAIRRAAIVSDGLNKSTDASTKDGINPAKVYAIYGATSLLASVEISLLIILGNVPKLRVIAKLPVFDKISSSLASVISRLWLGTQFNLSKSETRPDEGGSDVELNKAPASRSPSIRVGITPRSSNANTMI